MLSTMMKESPRGSVAELSRLSSTSLHVEKFGSRFTLNLVLSSVMSWATRTLSPASLMGASWTPGSYEEQKIEGLRLSAA